MERLGRGALLGVLALLGTAAASAPASEVEGKIAYPEGYRHWTHVKSALVWGRSPATASFAGLHAIYANEAGLAGYRTGAFADGAVLAFDLFDLEETADGVQPGRRKSLAVMARDSARFASTGGWGYEEFRGDALSERVDADGRAGCVGCHARAPGNDGVFSEFPE